MTSSHKLRLSRRQFLFTASLPLTSALLAACDMLDDSDDSEPVETPEPTPTPASTPKPESPEDDEDDVIVEETPTPEPTQTPTPQPVAPITLYLAAELEQHGMPLAERVGVLIEEAVLASGYPIEDALNEQDANIVIAPVMDEPESGRATLYGDPLIPVAANDLFVSQISAEDLQRALNGELDNWIHVGGPDRAVLRIDHPVSPISSFDPVARVDQTGEISSLVLEHPGAISLVPRAEVDYFIQALVIDDTDPLRDELTRENWPWWERVQVKLGPDLDPDLQHRLRQMIEDLNEHSTAPSRTMLTVAGDIILGRTVHSIMSQRNDFLAPYRLVADELQRGDLTLGNLECALTNSFSPPTDPTTFSFMTYPEAIEGLQFAGFHALSGANNHSMDFGPVGIQDTRATVEGAGIQYFGAGANLDEARRPAVLEHNGIRFAFLGYDSISMNYAAAGPNSGGIAPMIREHVVEDIQRARDQADVVIPYFHWGVEYVLTPQEPSRRMAYAAIDAGADLVIGSHPHWVQGMEFYDGKPIFYSLSNFVFDQEWSLETKQSMILHLTFDQTRLVGFRIVPALIEEFHRPRLVEGEMRDIILERFWRSTGMVESTPIV